MGAKKNPCGLGWKQKKEIWKKNPQSHKEISQRFYLNFECPMYGPSDLAIFERTAFWRCETGVDLNG